MKKIDYYSKLGLTNEEEIFNYLINQLKNTIRSYDYYVAWDKVIGNISSIEESLNLLNILIGDDNIEERFKKLIIKYPIIVTAIPILIAVRDNQIDILDSGIEKKYCFFEKQYFSDKEIVEIVEFSKKCGLLDIFSDRKIKNIVDYALGVEVGLDTNARKNRSGTIMEDLIEKYINAICSKNNFKYLTQANPKNILNFFGKKVPVDKTSRKYDFAIDNGEKIYLIEVNYYAGGGSKLKSVAGEFNSLFNLIKQNKDVSFIWITDGKGWTTTTNSLKETFLSTDYIFNIKMIEDGLLEEVITKGL